jgi:hypothetical protein
MMATETTDTAVAALAAEYRALFSEDTRNDDSKFWSVTDHANEPPELHKLCMDAHLSGPAGDPTDDLMLPDDYRYAFIVEALDAISEWAGGDELDDCLYDDEIDTHTLTDWLHSRTDRYAYVDGVVEEYGQPMDGLINALVAGQLAEREEVYHSVLSSLRQIVEDRDDDGDAE